MSSPPDEGPERRSAAVADTAEMPLDEAIAAARQRRKKLARGGDLEPGTMLGSLYKVIKKLGEGGMGTVYEVEHVRMQKRFAGKVLKRELGTPEHIQRLEREAMAASSIEHPNIVRVVNLDETDDGQVFLICELLHGEDLSMVVRERPMPIREALNVAYQVASALEATHRQGIIHRDLKPENIFLTERLGETLVKVLDFGVSKVNFGADKQRLTEVGSAVGTPIYMSPENAQGQDDLDARADIYSLGIIIYEMVTGTVPFFGTKALDIMFQHIHKQPDPPSYRRVDLPADIDKLVLKALRKKPADRYQTMAEFKEAITVLGKRFGFSPVTLPEASLDGIPQFQTPDAIAVAHPQVRKGSINPAILGAAAVIALVGGLLLLSADGDIVEPKRHRGLASRPARPTVKAPLSPTVKIKLASEPAGAEVYADDRLLGTTPVEVSMDRGDVAVGLRFVAPGHEVLVKTVVPSEDRELTASLKTREVRKPRIRTEAKAKPPTNMPKIKTTR